MASDRRQLTTKFARGKRRHNRPKMQAKLLVFDSWEHAMTPIPEGLELFRLDLAAQLQSRPRSPQRHGRNSPTH